MGNPSNKIGRYAVLDFETTGKFAKVDRVIEVGIVVLDEDYSTIYELDSLVKVNRDLGPVHIHGIKSKWLVSAPTFQELAPRIIAAISGKIIVGHNVAFDLQFLVAELNRVGINVIYEDFNTICTMSLSRKYASFSDNKLITVASELGIPYPDAHVAISDARITAQLFETFSASLGDQFATPESGVEFDTYTDGAAPVSRSDVEFQEPLTYIQRLVRSIKRAESSGEENEYFELLAKSLYDGELSEVEITTLLKNVDELSLSVEQVRRAHSKYFEALCSAAWADGVLTSTEEAEIRRIGFLLGISEFEIESALAAAPPEGNLPRLEVFSLEPGDIAVLTGSMQPPKSEIAQMLQDLGVAVASGVSKKVKLLVAADADSSSSKAVQAREYGIKIVEPSYIVKLHSQSIGASGA